ncbi:MAG: hypothetical protein FJX59_21080 [Alphaproteobacteria bacterium]|nr:hypothetical protein [Alphaproteobacteria bacterium]
MRLGGVFDRLRGRPVEDAPGALLEDPEDFLFGAEPLKILVSPLAGDTAGTAARHIFDRLSGRGGVQVRMAERPLTAPGADNSQPVFLAMAVDLGRRWIMREKADLLIWGESVASPPPEPGAAPGTSWRLRFLGATTPVPPQGATLSSLERLEVPAFFAADVGDLVFGAVMAAVNVEALEGLRSRAALFGPTLKRVRHVAEGDMHGSVAECATAQATYAAMLLLDGARSGDVSTLERAVSVYRGALILGGDAFAPHEQAMISTHIADALLMIADLTGDRRLNDKTVAYYLTALGMVRKDVFSDDFAALKTRLGVALQALAEVSGETRLLDEAADSFNAATGIWTLSESPARWADIQNSIGGLLITMGKLTRQPSLFDKAVGVFLKIAEVMGRTRAPLIWATTLANIGAALKEKGVAVKSPSYLTKAAEAYDQAEQVFNELNLDGNARLVESQRAEALRF